MPLKTQTHSNTYVCKVDESFGTSSISQRLCDTDRFRKVILKVRRDDRIVKPWSIADASKAYI